MKRHILFFLAIPMTLLIYAETWGRDRVAPPRSEAELKEMMSVTWDQEVLPEGASAATLERLLAKGEVMIMNDDPPGGMPWMTMAGVMVDAPVEVVFGVATDFDSYPELVPMTSAGHAEPVAGIENLYEVSYVIELLFSWLSVEFSVYHYHRPPHRTDWCYASGEFDVNVGFWQFIPADKGRRTMAFYSVYSLPRQAAVQALYRDQPELELMTNVATATMIVRAAKAEAEKRAGAGLRPLQENAGVERILMDDPRTLRLLSEKGKVLVLEDGPTVYITAGTVVSAPVEKAYSVIADFTSYPEFMPGVKKAEEIMRQGNEVAVRQQVKYKLWAFTFDQTEENHYLLDPPGRIEWHIRRQNGDVEGFWRFIALDGNRKCLMFNGNTADLRNMGLVPRTALRLEPTLEYGILAAQTTANMDSFKKRIHHRSSSGK